MCYFSYSANYSKCAYPLLAIYSHTWKISTVHSYCTFKMCLITVKYICCRKSYFEHTKIQIQPCDKNKAWSPLRRSILTKKQNLSHACLEKYRTKRRCACLSTYHSSPTIAWSRSHIYWLQTSASKLTPHPLSFTGQFHRSPITTLSRQNTAADCKFYTRDPSAIKTSCPLGKPI